MFLRTAGKFFLMLACGLLAGLLVPSASAQDSSPPTTGYRLSSKKRTSQPGAKREGSKAAKKGSKDPQKQVVGQPGIKLGPAAGTAEIPPELKQLAQEAATAISRLDWSKARDLYVEMVKKAPHNPLVYANLGVAEFELKNYLAAEGNIKKSLSLNPTMARNWMTLGLIQYERGDLVLAISSLTRAIHEDPRSPQAHLYLAAVTYEYGWTDAAIGELKRVIELDPKLSEAHYNLALTYLNLQPPKTELARRHYFEAIDLGAARSPEVEKFLRNSSE